VGACVGLLVALALEPPVTCANSMRTVIQYGVRWWGALALVAGFGAVSSGCASAGGRASPRAALVAFQRAIERNDVDALYQMLPANARRDESLPQFRQRIQGERAELRSVSDEVRRALDGRRSPWLALPSRAGGTVTVVDTADGWRMGRPAIGPGPAPTPQDAARALREAIARRNLAAILSTLSSRSRGAVQSELAMLLDALEDPAALEVRPTSAGPGGTESIALRLPDGRSLILVREGSDWRVDDIQ
jgi:hypothetical protein